MRRKENMRVKFAYTNCCKLSIWLLVPKMSHGVLDCENRWALTEYFYLLCESWSHSNHLDDRKGKFMLIIMHGSGFCICQTSIWLLNLQFENLLNESRCPASLKAANVNCTHTRVTHYPLMPESWSTEKQIRQSCKKDSFAFVLSGDILLEKLT